MAPEGLEPPTRGLRSRRASALWPEFVEAATASGLAARTSGVIADLDSIAARSEPPILSLSLACARPLLAANEQAEALFVAALAHDLAGYPFLGARTRFSFGRWLHRQRRTADSRAPLR